MGSVSSQQQHGRAPERRDADRARLRVMGNAAKQNKLWTPPPSRLCHARRDPLSECLCILQQNAAPRTGTGRGTGASPASRGTGPIPLPASHCRPSRGASCAGPSCSRPTICHTWPGPPLHGLALRRPLWPMRSRPEDTRSPVCRRRERRYAFPFRPPLDQLPGDVAGDIQGILGRSPLRDEALDDRRGDQIHAPGKFLDMKIDDPLPVQSTMNSFAPVRVEERWGSALSATW